MTVDLQTSAQIAFAWQKNCFSFTFKHQRQGSMPLGSSDCAATTWQCSRANNRSKLQRPILYRRAGGKVWCEEGHYPRKLFDGMDQGAASWRCVCMEGIGWSDLLQVYPDCSPEASECVTSPPAE